MIIEDDNPYSVRAWLLNELEKTFPLPCNFEVNQHNMVDGVFLSWTGHNWDSLLKRWKTKPRYSTCADFLFFVNRKICENNRHVIRTGAEFKFKPFGLNTCGANGKGWHPSGEIPFPKSGDFYQTRSKNKPSETAHVGIVLSQKGIISYLGGGAGQPGISQGIKRSLGSWPPSGLMGWLDIDEYYQ